jgi:hypothetical protein
MSRFKIIGPVVLVALAVVGLAIAAATGGLHTTRRQAADVASSSPRDSVTSTAAESTPDPATPIASVPLAVSPPRGGAATTAAAAGPVGSSSSCPLPRYPSAACTGVPAGTALAVVNGDMTVTSDHAVVTGKDVRGCIDVEAVGVTIKDTKAQCITTTNSDRARDPANPRLTIEDSEIACPNVDGSTGIGDRNINVYRVNIHSCENGFDMDSDATILDNYIHDLHQSVIAHTDGLQSAVGSNLIIEHNTIYGDTLGACGVASGHTGNCGGTSAINVNNNPAGPHTTNLIISYNLLAGGAYTLYCPIPAMTNVQVSYNHFSRMFYPNSGNYGTSSACLNDNGSPRTSVWTGNVWNDTGAAI